VISAAPFASEAAEPSETERTHAQVLFDEGRQLLVAGDYEHACTKFAESQRLDPGGGTLLNLAVCHEHQGKIVTAWTEFNEALSIALRDGRDERQRIAREHLLSLSPRLSNVRLEVLGPGPDLEIRLDGVRIARAMWTSALPVEAGDHVIEARAPAKRLFSVRVKVASAESTRVEIPPLLDEPVPPAPVPPAPPALPPPRPAHSDSRWIAGYLTGGAGLLALGVGAFFGVRAISKKNESDALCARSPCSDASAVSLNDEALTAAWIANVGVGVGIAAIAVGTYLVLTSSGPAMPRRTGRRTPLAIEW
jgi:hypothetical protein